MAIVPPQRRAPLGLECIDRHRYEVDYRWPIADGAFIVEYRCKRNNKEQELHKLFLTIERELQCHLQAI